LNLGGLGCVIVTLRLGGAIASLLEPLIKIWVGVRLRDHATTVGAHARELDLRLGNFPRQSQQLRIGIRAGDLQRQRFDPRRPLSVIDDRYCKVSAAVKTRVFLARAA